ncbi:MAG: DUF2298 domain-containing protein [Microgenomates group bacterium]|nr:DUF2298 domain-containing protein [Microgenomates group bacterium]
MEWLSITFNWYLYLLLLGAIFFPLTAKLFNSFFDFGYPFAKTVAIVFISYLVFFLGVTKLISFTQLNLFLIITLIIIINLFVFSKKKVRIKIPFLLILIFEEILFLASLIFLTYIRGQEPSIRGLEKFMDFGFINSILRSKYFPPLDMWLSSDQQSPNGYPINYYYFGHLTGAFLIKLTSVKPAVGYNLILATIFAQAITLSFSLAANIIYLFLKQTNKFVNYFQVIVYGFLGSFIVNLGGNLHTIYTFTKGYPNENPIPFWKIFSTYNPSQYWYPNATRFIPFTIHEFPVYSYVVADLHGHVFDIPLVLLTLSLLFNFFLYLKKITPLWQEIKPEKKLIKNLRQLIATDDHRFLIMTTIFLGFMTAIHYMTNAFDGPIYLLLTLIFFLIIHKNSLNFLIHSALLIFCFMIFSLPFSLNFSPFVSGIGVNCSPGFLVNLQKFGPFLFEKGNCQVSPLWMLFTLWGFFWVNFFFFLIIKKSQPKFDNLLIEKLDVFILTLFSFSTLLLIIPEFFYIKDIYPAHFRANTMFKLGYQAFIMMGFASTYTFFRMNFIKPLLKFIFRSIFLFLFFFIAIYPFFAFPSYYGRLNRLVELDGSLWLNNIYPADKEIIDYLNNHVDGQPVILEAQGDSYTDFERISAYTGLPTVAGWWVHEWLWRGSSDVVGNKIPDIVNLYESKDIQLTKNLIKQYQIKYIIISTMEKEKYKNLDENKFDQITTPIFVSSDKKGVIYQVN